MRLGEAENLIGRLVITGMVNGGYYIGELVKVLPSKPFRAEVKVKGLYEYPKLYNHNTRPLTFKTHDIVIIPENEVINTGNSIKLFEEKFVSYNDSLKIALSKYLSAVYTCLDGYKRDNANYHTYYVGSMVDCIKLKKILEEKYNSID